MESEWKNMQLFMRYIEWQMAEVAISVNCSIFVMLIIHRVHQKFV